MSMIWIWILLWTLFIAIVINKFQYYRNEQREYKSKLNRADSCPHLWEKDGGGCNYDGDWYNDAKALQCPKIDIGGYSDIKYSPSSRNSKIEAYSRMKDYRCNNCDYWKMSPEEVATEVLAVKNKELARSRPAEYKQVIAGRERALQELDETIKLDDIYDS